MENELAANWFEGAIAATLNFADTLCAEIVIFDKNRVLYDATNGASDCVAQVTGAQKVKTVRLGRAEDDDWIETSIESCRKNSRIEAQSRIVKANERLVLARFSSLPLLENDTVINETQLFSILFRELDAIKPAHGATELGRHHDLSPSEVVVVSLLAEDKSLQEIADHLNVTIHTVRSQVKSAMRKTDSPRQSVLVAKTYRYSH